MNRAAFTEPSANTDFEAAEWERVMTSSLPAKDNVMFAHDSAAADRVHTYLGLFTLLTA